MVVVVAVIEEVVVVVLVVVEVVVLVVVVEVVVVKVEGRGVVNSRRSSKSCSRRTRSCQWLHFSQIKIWETGMGLPRGRGVRWTLIDYTGLFKNTRMKILRQYC